MWEKIYDLQNKSVSSCQPGTPRANHANDYWPSRGGSAHASLKLVDNVNDLIPQIYDSSTIMCSHSKSNDNGCKGFNFGLWIICL